MIHQPKSQNPLFYGPVRRLHYHYTFATYSLETLLRPLHFSGTSETRKTHKAVFSEPKLVIPEEPQPSTHTFTANAESEEIVLDTPGSTQVQSLNPSREADPSGALPKADKEPIEVALDGGKKRPREEIQAEGVGSGPRETLDVGGKELSSRKKRRKKHKEAKP